MAALWAVTLAALGAIALKCQAAGGPVSIGRPILVATRTGPVTSS